LISAAAGGKPAAGSSRRLGHLDFALLSIYWVAVGYLWTSLGGLIIPDLVLQLVGRAHKGVALAVLEGIGALMAVVWQPVVGAISDRTHTRWGRRRPFIVVGTVGDVIFLIGLALSGSYWLVVVFYFLLQTASNTAQGPYQGLMPDVVPSSQRGTASGYYGVSNVIGLLAGLWGYLGVYRSRPASRNQLIVAAVIAAVIIGIVVLPIVNNPAYSDPSNGYPSWVFTAIVIIGIVAAIMVAGFILVRRDLAGLWVAIAGVITGIVAAIVSAPIAAYVFGGVTGSGVDVIVAALRQGGSDVLHASLGQGLFSDPIDKTITSFVVFMVLAGLSRQMLARFPNGERLIGRPAD